MMHSRDLPPIFWVEVVNCVNYMQNHTPHQELNYVTLEEDWSRTNPYVSCFIVFGSHAWDFILKTKHEALDKKSKSLIFIGYSEDMKVYRLIDLDTHDLFFHTHIHFDEHLFISFFSLTLFL